MVANRERRWTVRNVLLGVLVLVVVYALLGFLVLPRWLETALPQRLEQHMGWQAEVGDIRVNPFVMSVEILGLSARDGDGEPIVAFDRFYANVGVWQLVTGVVALQNLELDEPDIRVDLLPDNDINLARDWQANNPATREATASGSDSGGAPRLRFDRVRIEGGELLFRDFTRGEPEEFLVTPLDLALNDLATWPRENSESNYYLVAAVGSQTIEWEGDLSIAPLYSRGFIKLGGVTHTTLQHFLKSYLPYELRGGTASLSSEYELESVDELFLTTSRGKLSIENLALGLNGSDRELMKADSIGIDDIRFGLASGEASTGTVTADGIVLSLQRDSRGDLNLLAPFRGSADDQQTAESPGDRPPLRWSVAGLELENSTVNWRDEQPRTAVDLELTDLDIRVDRISHDLGEPVSYEAGASLGDGGRLAFNGQVTPEPFTLAAGVTGSDIGLAPFSGYISEAANLVVNGGRLNVDGNLNLDQQQDPLTGTFSGTGEVASLELRLEDDGDPLLQWQSLRLAPVEYNVAPARLEIGTVSLAAPALNVVRQASGLHNLQRVLRSGSAGDGDKQPPAEGGAASAGGDDPTFIFRIGQLVLEDGNLAYTDRTLDPAFATRFDQLQGSVTGLSNVPPQQGKVSLRGRVGEVASMVLDGSVGTLGTEEISELQLDLQNLSLPVLSPYFGRYLGYGVDSGQLNLEMDYTLSGTSIDASNRVVLDRLELGSPVPSEDAVNAPVKLGLALLRDGDGTITINLPVSGDLSSPDFSVGGVVMRAFVNAIAKAATSPFSVLGSIADMAGLSGEELGEIRFEPGRVELAEGEKVKLEAMGAALNERPALVLSVRGAVSPRADSQGLRRERLFSQLDIAGSAPLAERVARLEQAYENSDNRATLETFRANSAGEDGNISQQEWEQVLVNRLTTDIRLPPEALGNLASARGIWLRRQMVEIYEVPASQLFLLDPVRDAGADDRGMVTVAFELDAR